MRIAPAENINEEYANTGEQQESLLKGTVK